MNDDDEIDLDNLAESVFPGINAQHREQMAALKRMMELLMTISDDISAKYAALVTKVDKLKTTDDSLVAFVNGLKTSITDLSKQLADAIAAGGDPTKLAAVSDGLTTLGDSIDAIEARDAIVATP